MINSNSELYGIIGHPVSHSLSPIMHNEAFKYLGLNKIYLAFNVTDVEKAILGVKGLNIGGLSITIPHKSDVMPYLDWIDDIAEKIGSVNTIVNEGGILKGYNTDGYGAYMSITNHSIDLNNKSALIIGNGGTAKSIAYTIIDRVNLECLYILGRSKKKLDIFINRLNSNFPDQKIIPIIEQDLSLLVESTEKSSIIINTTPIGMAPFEDRTPIDFNLIKSRHTVFDVVYKPFRTKLLKESVKRNARIIDGLDMLVNQGIIQFELWTNKKAPVEIMYKTVYDCVNAK